MSWTRVGRRVAVVLLGASLVWSPVAHAGQLSNTAVDCTFTPNRPVLNSTKQLSGSATLTCTNKSRSLQYITMKIVLFELNSKGVTYNYMGNAYQASKQFSVKAGSKATFSLATSAKSCVSQETGNDEYGTEVLVTHVGTGNTALDRFTPTNDLHAC